MWFSYHFPNFRICCTCLHTSLLGMLPSSEVTKTNSVYVIMHLDHLLTVHILANLPSIWSPQIFNISSFSTCFRPEQCKPWIANHVSMFHSETESNNPPPPNLSWNTHVLHIKYNGLQSFTSFVNTPCVYGIFKFISSDAGISTLYICHHRIHNRQLTTYVVSFCMSYVKAKSILNWSNLIGMELINRPSLQTHQSSRDINV